MFTLSQLGRQLGRTSRRLGSSKGGKSSLNFQRPVQRPASRHFSRSSRDLKEDNRISVTWPSGNGNEVKLSTKWLRDHCHCEQCVNQDTIQRGFDSFVECDDVPASTESTDEGLKVTWKKNNHTSLYSWDWLSSHMQEHSPQIKRTFWGSEIKSDPPSVHYDEIMSDDGGVGYWTSKILEYGFCFVDGCPVSPEQTEKLLERIAFIRQTHYGGFYDFTADLTMKDTAYTTLALPAHTDTTYFTDPAGLQMFHLLSHTEGSGGASLLVDGFSCADQLRRADPNAFEILCKVPIRWHASGNEGIVITPAQKYPVFNIDPAADYEPGNSIEEDLPLMQIRWNNDDRATMPLQPAPGISYDEWFEAAKLWNSIIKAQENEYWEQLVPGRPLIFDNWRVMHGRSVFTGRRRICGGYVNRDDFVSRYWNTNFSRSEILQNII